VKYKRSQVIMLTTVPASRLPMLQILSVPRIHLEEL
jgi:hypothetical protein